MRSESTSSEWPNYIGTFFALAGLLLMFWSWQAVSIANREFTSPIRAASPFLAGAGMCFWVSAWSCWRRRWLLATVALAVSCLLVVSAFPDR